MSCRDARTRCQRALDEGVVDPALDRHLAQCAECRRYDTDMRRLRAMLGTLRDETESLTTSAARTGESPAVHGRYRLGRGMALAASIALLVLLGRFWARSVTTDAPTAPPLIAATAPNDARLGISLRGESATTLLAIAAPPTDTNVQVFFLYPRLDAAATRGEPGNVK